MKADLPLSCLPLAQWLSAPRPANTLISWHGQNVWTLGQLRQQVAELTQQLTRQPGQRLALCFDNSYLFIVALLATLHAGKTPVIPGHCRAELLDEQRTLFDGVLSDLSLPCRSPLIQLCPSDTGTRTPPPLPAIAPHQHVELFTSGSSGQPRRVVKPLTCLDNEAQLLATWLAGRLAGCRVVASVTHQHQYGLTFRVMLPMALGLPLHAAMLYYPEQLTALDAAHRYIFISSPAFLKRLDYQLAPPPVAVLLSAGGDLPWPDVLNARDWCGCAVDEIYGSTETGVLAWRYRDKPVCPWQTFSGVTLQAQSAGQGQPAAVRAISPLIPQPQGVLLDDTLQFDSQGGFQLTGRRGRVVKIEDKRVSLYEVERRLLALDGVCDAAALMLDNGRRQGIGALLVLDDDAYPRWLASQGKDYELAWRRALLAWLDPVAVPRYWRVVRHIPVNNMGKRVNAHLQELFNAASDAAP